MLRSISSRMVMLVLVAGFMWGCDGERATQPKPLGKVAADGSAVVVVTVQAEGVPVSGVVVELSRSIAGVAASYEWSATTDENGQARIEVTSSGYYQARVVQDGNEVGYQASIPLNVGTEVPLNLTIAALEPVADPREVTRAYVEAAIARYERDGLDATLAYYNSLESIEGERSLMILQAGDQTLLASALFIQFVGKNAPIPIPQGSEEGQWLWTETRNFNPVTKQEEPSLVLAVIHDGLIFISSHSTLRENRVNATQAYVQAAIDLYERDGLDATIEYYGSRESIDGQHYLFLVDEHDLYLAHPIFPQLKGTDIKDVVSSDGQKLGEEIAKATQEGQWIEYPWPDPVTGVEEPKSTWAIRHDGIIFASGYYTPALDAEPPAWQDADPVAYTVEYVEQAIARYERDGLEAMVDYYNSVASFHGQWYLFVMDANDLYIVQPIFPQLKGTDIKEVVGSDGYELGKDIAKATEEGHWAEYLWPHPSTLLEVHKVAYAVRHDGLIFASGYYPVVEDPRAYTVGYVEQAIAYYEREGREATVAYYNSAESIDGDWYLVLLDETDAILTNAVFPNLLGMNHQSVGLASGFEPIGDGEVIDATEEGHWSSYSFFNPATSEDDQMHTYAIRYDGIIFSSAYFSGE